MLQLKQIKMLVKTNEKDSKGKDLYINKLTGIKSTLADAVVFPSTRRERRHLNDGLKINNRKSHGEMIVQKITLKKQIADNVFVLTNKVKAILHFTKGALQRKEAHQKFMTRFN